MFETAELGKTVPRGTFKKTVPLLRQELLELQEELRELDHSQVVMVFAGVDGGGKGQTVNLLNEWMDPRWLITRAFDRPADIERERPLFWRYWLSLPPRGRIGMYLGSWYSDPVLDRVYERIDDAELDKRLERIVAFETALADDHAVILKFWMHLSRDAQYDRLKNLETDPLQQARVTAKDWEHWERYDQFISAAERVIMRTSTGQAAWHIVEGADAAYRSITVGTLLRDNLRRRLEEIRLERQVKSQLKSLVDQEPRSKKSNKNQPASTSASASKGSAADDQDASPSTSSIEAAQQMTVLSQLDMDCRLSKPDYRERLVQLQAELVALHRAARARDVSTILVFEGPDAAGKGGAIRRINAALDARNYQVHGFSTPSDEERAQHYLWRFWRHLSRAGRLSIFDRSWYGRVLVERVEGLASEDEWRRAYREINDFEAQLVEHGIVLVKFWIHITKAEQLKRFRMRERTPYKRWKLTDEDWRNRDKWLDYELAVNDMVQYTSTQLAPWTLVEGNNKRFARIKCLETVCERLEQALDATPGAAAGVPSALHEQASTIAAVPPAAAQAGPRPAGSLD